MKENVAIGPDAGPAKEVHQKLQSKSMFDSRTCEWCGEEYHPSAASCGTGHTWSLYKCPHCGKFTAEGWAIPEAARTPDTKVIETEPIGANAMAQAKWNEAMDEQCARTIENALKHIPSSKELAHILWRTAKQLVSLLEKEYGFGQKVGSKHLIGYEAYHSNMHKEMRDPPNRQITCAGCRGTFEVVDNRSGTVNEIIYCASCAESLHGVQIEGGDVADSLKSGVWIRKVGEEWPIYIVGSFHDGLVFCKWPNGDVTGNGDLAELERLAREGKLVYLDPDPTVAIGGGQRKKVTASGQVVTISGETTTGL